MGHAVGGRSDSGVAVSTGRGQSSRVRLGGHGSAVAGSLWRTRRPPAGRARGPACGGCSLLDGRGGGSAWDSQYSDLVRKCERVY